MLCFPFYNFTFVFILLAQLVCVCLCLLQHVLLRFNNNFGFHFQATLVEECLNQHNKMPGFRLINGYRVSSIYILHTTPKTTGKIGGSQFAVSCFSRIMIQCLARIASWVCKRCVIKSFPLPDHPVRPPGGRESQPSDAHPQYMGLKFRPS